MSIVTKDSPGTRSRARHANRHHSHWYAVALLPVLLRVLSPCSPWVTVVFAQVSLRLRLSCSSCMERSQLLEQVRIYLNIVGHTSPTHSRLSSLPSRG